MGKMFYKFDTDDTRTIKKTDNEQLTLMIDSGLTEYLFRYLKSRKDITYETVSLPAFLYVNEKTSEDMPAVTKNENFSDFKSKIDELAKKYPDEKFYFYRCKLESGCFKIYFAHLPIDTHLHQSMTSTNLAETDEI